MFTRDGEKRCFTPDGHMVGSIGEALAAYHYNIELHPASYEKHDGVVDGRQVQAKATQKTSVAITSNPDYLLVLKISKDGVGEEVYNGSGNLVWERVMERSKGVRPKNGQYRMSFKELKQLMLQVPEAERIKRVRP